MKRWIVPIVLTIALISTGVWGYNQYTMNQQYKVHMENIYEKSFYDLVGEVGNVGNGLAKLMVSGDKSQHVSLLSEISRQADAAQTELGQLPISHTALAKTSKYLNQLSDYTYFLTKKVAEGMTLTQEEMDSIVQLQKSAVNIDNELSKLQEDIAKDGISWYELIKSGDETFYDVSENIVTEQFVNIEKTSIDYPSLIYDGPFSETLNQTVKLKGKEVSEEEAKDIAKDFVGQKRTLSIESAGGGTGMFDTWGFNIISNGEENPIYIQVTKTAGKVVSMIAQNDNGEAQLSIEQAIEKAKKFMDDRGYPNMESTYHQILEGVATINFAYNDEDTIMYPDLIKVKISLDNGEIYGFEAANYLSAHKERMLEKPELTIDEAEQLVNSNLDISSSNIAVIPTEGGNEKLCYEFKGKCKGAKFIIYIDANTGQEAKIFQVIDTENGSLVI